MLLLELLLFEDELYLFFGHWQVSKDFFESSVSSKVQRHQMLLLTLALQDEARNAYMRPGLKHLDAAWGRISLLFPLLVYLGNGHCDDFAHHLLGLLYRGLLGPNLLLQLGHVGLVE